MLDVVLIAPLGICRQGQFGQGAETFGQCRFQFGLAIRRDSSGERVRARDTHVSVKTAKMPSHPTGGFHVPHQNKYRARTLFPVW